MDQKQKPIKVKNTVEGMKAFVQEITRVLLNMEDISRRERKKVVPRSASEESCPNTERAEDLLSTAEIRTEEGKTLA